LLAASGYFQPLGGDFRDDTCGVCSEHSNGTATVGYVHHDGLKIHLRQVECLAVLAIIKQHASGRAADEAQQISLTVNPPQTEGAGGGPLPFRQHTCDREHPKVDTDVSKVFGSNKVGVKCLANLGVG
jgi:hypothetical protein